MNLPGFGRRDIRWAISYRPRLATIGGLIFVALKPRRDGLCNAAGTGTAILHRFAAAAPPSAH